MRNQLLLFKICAGGGGAVQEAWSCNLDLLNHPSVCFKTKEYPLLRRNSQSLPDACRPVGTGVAFEITAFSQGEIVLFFMFDSY
jgi:hypothetical protein